MDETGKLAIFAQYKAAKEFDFSTAARYRDELFEIEQFIKNKGAQSS